MYDQILKQMQGSFVQNNPKLFGKPGGFTNQSFNFNAGKGDDIIKPGGGGGPVGGGDGDVGGGNGDGDGDNNNGGSNIIPGQTVYGGQFQTQFGEGSGNTLSDLLGGYGYGTGFLSDPGARFGFGKDTEYGKYFGTFDSEGYQEALASLGALQEQKFKDIGRQYEYGRGQLQGSLQDTLLEMMGEESVSGLVGGRAGARRGMTRELGESKFSDLGRQTEAKYGAAQEQTAKQLGMLEGTLADFIAKQQNIALNIEMSDPTMTSGGSTTWKDIPTGNPMTADQLSEYKGMFGDLPNSEAAFNNFVSLAHSNLTSDYLHELAQAIYNQYQTESESGGT